MSTYQNGDVRYGVLYEEILQGTLTFNSSYSNLISKGYRLFGAGNVSYILIPSDGGGFDGIILTSGNYQDFYGDHTKNGLKGGAIHEAGFYKNAKVVDYGDGTYDIQDFEYSRNLIASIPLGGMTVDQFLAALATRGNTYSPLNLIKELLKTDNRISGDNQGESTVVDGFDGNDDFYISSSAQFARGGAGNDLFQGTPTGAAILDGGLGDDRFDGSSGSSDRTKQYLWVGGKGENLYRGPNLNTIVVIDQKTSGQASDIITYADLVLARQNQKTGYVVVKTSTPDVNQLDLRFVDQPLIDSTGKKVAESGYFSVLYKGVEQVKINPMSGGWSLNGFIAEKDPYENNIRAAIAVASMEQLIVPSNYSATALQEIKKDYGLTTISDRATVDLRGQTLLDKSSYVSIADRFFLTEIKQNNATGQLELIFNQTVGTIGSTTIYELDSAGKPIKYAYFGSLKKDGNKVITSISNQRDTRYLAVLTSGWSSQSGLLMEGQGNYGSSGTQSYQFTFGKDTVAPAIQSIRQENGKIVIVYSENVQLTSSSAANPIAYLSRVARPTSMSDVVYTFTSADAVIEGNTLNLVPKTVLDGEYYLIAASVKDATGNISQNPSTSPQLTFEDPLAAARRVTIDRKQDNSFLLPVTVYRTGTDLTSNSWSFSWAQAGKSTQNSPSVYFSTNDYPSGSGYIYTTKQNATPLLVTIDDFVAEGVHRLHSIQYHGFGYSSSSLLDTPEEINAQLKAWGLEPGSLDLNIVGKGLTPEAALTSLSLSKSTLDLSNPSDFISGNIQFSFQTGDPYYDRNAQISSLNLRYGTPTTWGFSSGPSFYLNRSGEILSSDQAAVFQLNTSNHFGLQAGEYVLQEVEVQWDSPRSIKQSLTPEQAAALGLPKNLTLVGHQTNAPKLVRELVDLKFSSNQLDCSTADTSLFVTAKVKVTGFEPTARSFLQEGINLGWQTPESSQTAYMAGWNTFFSESLSPVRYVSVDDGQAVLIEFEGLLSVPENTFTGSYVLRNVTLLNRSDYNRGDTSTTLLISEQIPQFAYTLNVSGGRVVAPFQLTDVDPPITALQPTLLDVDQVSIASPGSRADVGLQLYVNKQTVPQSPVDNFYTYFLKAYFGLADDAPNPVGLAVLTSPSGRQWKTIFITDQDQVSPEDYWRNSYPSVIKYQPKISFTASDEPGTWRLSHFSHWSGSSLRSDAGLGINAIYGTAKRYFDDQLSELNTEVLAAKLRVQPSDLQLQVVNPFFSGTLPSALTTSPRIYGYTLEFEQRQVAAGASQLLQVTLETAEPLLGTKGVLASDGFNSAASVIALRLRHEAEHLLSNRTDLSVKLSRSNITSETLLPSGRYRTQFRSLINVPPQLYGGRYIVDQLYALTPLDVIGNQEKYRRTYDHIPLLRLPDDLRFEDAQYGLSPGLVRGLTPDRIALLQHQASLYSSISQSTSVFDFIVDGAPLPTDHLNPARADDLLDVVFSAKVVKLSQLAPEAALEFSLSVAGYQALLDANRDLLSVSNRIDSLFDVSRPEQGLWVSLVHSETGTTSLVLASRASQVASTDRHQFVVNLDRTFLSGDYRVANLQVSYNGLLPPSLSSSQLANGLSSAELRYLDSRFGALSQFTIENSAFITPSLSLHKLGFDRWSPPPMAVVVRDQTPPIITAPSGLKDATVILALESTRGTIGRFTANESVTWSIDSRGRDAALFVVSTNGELSFASTQIPAQPKYSVDLQATDPSGNRTTQTLILQSPSEPPTPVDDSGDTSAELPIVLIDLPTNLRSFNVASLPNVNTFPFAKLGVNSKLLNWSQVNFTNLSPESLLAIDWAQVDYVKAQKSSSFGLQYIDWQELHANSKTAAAAYKQISWSKHAITADVAESLNPALLDYRLFDPSKLIDANAFPFSQLGSNHSKFDWSKLSYDQLTANSIADIDWTRVDYIKAQKSKSFLFDNVDWVEVNGSTRAPAIYKQMAWGSRPISSDVASGLVYAHLDLAKFDISRLADINDIQFQTLGQNSSKFPWAKVNYGILTAESLSSIDWSRVPLAKASLAPSFQLAHVDWDEVSASKTALAAATTWFKSAAATNLLASAAADALTGLNPTALLGAHKLVTFTAAGTTYGLVTTAVDAYRARAASGLVGGGGGHLAELETEAEASALSQALFDPLTGLLRPSTPLWRQLSGSVAKDGGHSRYLWLGGSDADQEGEWKWLRGGEISLDRVEWGEGQGLQEPDNFGPGAGQDALALALQRWPLAAKVGAQIGDAGEWNDLSSSNRLGFLVEF